MASLILCTDELRLTRNGIFYAQNVRYWATQNEHYIYPGNFQESFVLMWSRDIRYLYVGLILLQVNHQIYFQYDRTSSLRQLIIWELAYNYSWSRSAGTTVYQYHPARCYQWGLIKKHVHLTPSAMQEILQNKVIKAFQTITEDMLKNVLYEMFFV